jgi:RNA polymerase sigma-70 factor (ECF subfamily)
VHEGVLVRLDEQDRSLWDEQQILEGRELLGRAAARPGAGAYVIQAAIADLHLQQPRDWHQIAALYGKLAQRTGSPVVELNRAVAIAELDGPDAGLALLEGLALEDYRYYHSTRADLLRRTGRPGDARAAYARALELAETDPERRFLTRRLKDLP